VCGRSKQRRNILKENPGRVAAGFFDAVIAAAY